MTAVGGNINFLTYPAFNNSCHDSYKGRSVREFIAACQRTTGHEIPVAEMPARPGDPSVAFADSTKLQQVGVFVGWLKAVPLTVIFMIVRPKELSWRPRYTDLDEALKSSWAWRQAHSQGY